MNSTARRSRGASNRRASTSPSIAALTTNPPRSAAAALSGWPSISVREAEQVRAGQRLAEERVAGDEPGDRRRGRRPETARQRDLVVHLDPPADAFRDLAADLAQGGLDALDAAVLAILRQLVLALALDAQLDLAAAPAADLDLDRGSSARARRRGSRSRRRDSRSTPGPRRSPAGRRARPASSSPSEGHRDRPDRRFRLEHRPGAGRRSRPSRDPSARCRSGRRRRAHRAGCRRARRPCVTPATLVADDGSQKIPSSLREAPVGGEDLVVRHRLDQAAALVAGGDRLRPRRRIADPDRRRDRVRLARPAGRGRAARRRRPGSRTSAAASRRRRPPRTRGTPPSRR